jgi:hypothetical protein
VVQERLGAFTGASEVSIFRPGGRIWTLAHHKRNERHGWAVIRQILERVGVSVEDWALRGER